MQYKPDDHRTQRLLDKVEGAAARSDRFGLYLNAEECLLLVQLVDRLAQPRVGAPYTPAPLSGGFTHIAFGQRPAGAE